MNYDVTVPPHVPAAPSVSAVQQAIEHIFPLVYEFRKDKSPEEAAAAARARHLAHSDIELDDSSDSSDD